jgi:hypothetical protein
MAAHAVDQPSKSTIGSRADSSGGIAILECASAVACAAAAAGACSPLSYGSRSCTVVCCSAAVAASCCCCKCNASRNHCCEVLPAGAVK